MSWGILKNGLKFFLVNPLLEKYVTVSQRCIFVGFSDISYVLHYAEKSIYNRTKEQNLRILARRKKEPQIKRTNPFGILQKKINVLAMNLVC